jgi:hypothetical protein
MLSRNSLHSLPIKRLVTCLLVPFAIGNLACSPVVAATLPVTNCNDAGNGSLRAALALAHSGDIISLTALTCSRISLTTGELLISVNDLTLQGPGADALTIAGGQAPEHSYAVLNHTGKGTFRVDALTVTDNQAQYQGNNSSRCVRSGSGTISLNRSTVTTCSGGGVYANGLLMRDSTISYSRQGVAIFGNVSIIGSTINGNSSADCAGIRLVSSTVLISNSTISGNVAFGTGFYTYDGHYAAGCILGRATITNSTVAFNGAGSYYSGGLNVQADVTIESSIFAHNYGSDLVAGLVSGHNNLITSFAAAVPADTIRTDPLLLPLADNGGPTLTHALELHSPAIDAGNNLSGLATDQRGASFARSVGAKPDIGAFESQVPAPPVVAIGPGFTGSWFDPAQSGHGLMLEVLTDHRVLAMWFAFNPEGTQQSWFGGVGTYSGNTATITDVALPTGGRWIPNFNPNAIVRNPWGTLTLTFTDCTHGRIDFNSVRGYGSGSMDLTRLTQPAGLACP